MAIPRIIHQVWVGKNDPQTPICLRILARTWQKYNPTWEYHLWNGKEINNLVTKYFPEYLSLYKKFPFDIQRWDMIRYMILYIYGGVYADLDTECFRPIDKLFENKIFCIGEEPLEHNIYPNVKHFIGNALMASDIRNEGWLYILKSIEEALQRKYSAKEFVLSTTGPLMISKIFPNLKKRVKAEILPYKDVSPVTIQDVRRYIILGERESFNKKVKKAYCAHYFFGTWISQIKQK